MQVSKISFRANNPKIQKPDYTERFLYTLPPRIEKPVEKKNNFLKMLAAFAIAATGMLVLVKGISGKGKNFVAKGVEELSDQTKGLNRLTQFKQTVAEVKNKILYPFKALMMGDKRFLEPDRLKSGMIIASENTHEVHDFMKAFREHAKELGMNVVPCPYKKLKTKEAAQEWVYNTFQKAQENYRKTGQHTFVDVGKIDFLITPKNLKTPPENIEKMLEALSQNKYEGVFWSGWSNNTKNLPFYFDKNPILVTKLAD